MRRFYDEHADRYHLPERVRARHVLVRVDKDAAEDKVADAQKRIDAALARIQGGEDFAKVASEVSEDPGSKDRGGDLGLFPRGQMVPAFEDVAFQQKDGETSEVVRTDFGFHVIRTEAHEAAKDRSFDEAAHEIAEELAGADRARALARETSDRLVEAVRSGKSLEDAAREASVPIEDERVGAAAPRRLSARHRRGAAGRDGGVRGEPRQAEPRSRLRRRHQAGDGPGARAPRSERRGHRARSRRPSAPSCSRRAATSCAARGCSEARARLTRDGDLVVDLSPLQGAS